MTTCILIFVFFSCCCFLNLRRPPETEPSAVHFFHSIIFSLLFSQSHSLHLYSFLTNPTSNKSIALSSLCLPQRLRLRLITISPRRSSWGLFLALCVCVYPPAVAPKIQISSAFLAFLLTSSDSSAPPAASISTF